MYILYMATTPTDGHLLISAHTAPCVRRECCPPRGHSVDSHGLQHDHQSERGRKERQHHVAVQHPACMRTPAATTHPTAHLPLS
jgi:hypothetical protein